MAEMNGSQGSQDLKSWMELIGSLRYSQLLLLSSGVVLIPAMIVGAPFVFLKFFESIVHATSSSSGISGLSDLLLPIVKVSVFPIFYGPIGYVIYRGCQWLHQCRQRR